MSAVKKPGRRGLVLALALVLCLNIACTTAFAAGGKVMSPAEFLSLANGDGVITVGENVTLTGRLEVTGALTLAVREGVTLTLPRCDDGLAGSSIRVPTGGKLTVSGEGSITSLGPVLIYAVGGEVVVNGCLLRAICTVLQIQGGKATVNDGTLTTESGAYYQTVYVDHGEFTLNGGAIENTTYGGGAITVHNGTSPYSRSTVTVRGGTVSNSGDAAAALSIEGESNVSIHGGTLANCGANAAALFIVRRSDVRIDGGTLENTVTDTKSVAVFEYDQSGRSTIAIEGGSISSGNGSALQIMFARGGAGGNANIVGTVFGNAVDTGKFTVDAASGANAAKLSEDGHTVELTKGVPHNTAYVYAASYENGRMTGIVSGKAAGSKITFNGKAAKGDQLFLLDENYAPVCSKMTVE